jgi:hypothetical protein
MMKTPPITFSKVLRGEDDRDATDAEPRQGSG